eukprot:15313193-Alexandrium_andersonii.AAC.1
MGVASRGVSPLRANSGAREPGRRASAARSRGAQLSCQGVLATVISYNVGEFRLSCASRYWELAGVTR